MTDGRPDDPRPGGAGLEALLDHLKQARAIDLTDYKRGTLARRVALRMADVGVASYEDYVAHLEVDPAEFGALYETVLINVTSFFRDPEAWAVLAADVLPELLGDDERPLRVWSAGCASGQEPYSVIMAVAERIGVEATQRRLKVYATDIDEHALGEARQATYTDEQVASLPAGLLERYFSPVGARWAFAPELRRCAIFGRHDLLQDAPISRVDLLLCRNTLMYFHAEAQDRVVERLHYALADRGRLLVGRVELLLRFPGLFRPLDPGVRLFAKVPRPTIRHQLLALSDGERGAADVGGPPHPVIDVVALSFEAAPQAQVIIDADGRLLHANRAARGTFGIADDRVGGPFRDVDLSYRPTELRASLDDVMATGDTVVLDDVTWAGAGAEPRHLRVELAALDGADGVRRGVVITFLDVTAERRLRDDLAAAHRQLETAYEELQSTNEELETTNEELQSTIEELETTNEELQSTNEELETMNEELASTNQELGTVNDELRLRTLDLDEVNAFLEQIMSGLPSSVVVVDRTLRVRVWSAEATRLWGLRADEAEGSVLLGLDVGLPVERLAGPVRACLTGADPGPPVEVDAHDRRGKPMRCVVHCSPLTGASGSVEGAVIVIEAASRDAP